MIPTEPQSTRDAAMVKQFESVRPAIRKRANRLIEGEDLYQETFLRCLQRPDLDWSRDHRGLIMRIAHDVSVDLHRSQFCFEKALKSRRLQPTTEFTSDPNALASIDDRDEMEWVRSKLRQYGAETEALIDDFLSGQCKRTLAIRTATSINTIRSRCYRTIKRLRDDASYHRRTGVA